MNIPKRHHFVPELIQKNFVDANGLLYFFNKSTPEKGAQPGKPGNIHVRTHLYSKVAADGSKDVTLELEYSRLEGFVSPILDKIIATALAGNTPAVDDEMRAIIDRFVVEQIRRVPEFHEKAMPVSAAEASMRRAVAMYEERHGLLTPDHRDKVFSPESVERYRHNARVGALRRAPEKIIDVLEQKSLVVCSVRKASSLLVGSNPAVRTGGVLSSIGAEVWLPIAPNVALLHTGPRVPTPRLFPIPDHVVRQLNHTIAKNSSIFAGRSAKHVEAVAGRLRLTAKTPPPT